MNESAQFVKCGDYVFFTYFGLRPLMNTFIYLLIHYQERLSLVEC